MIWIQGTILSSRWIGVVLGSLTYAGALLGNGSPLGALLGVVALTCACAGLGRAWERLAGERASLATSVVIGLAWLLVISTVVARLGVLGPPVQLAVLAVGILACGLPFPDAPRDPPRPPGWILGLSLAAGVMLVAIKVLALSPWFSDGVNLSMEVKRLWDTGGLGPLPHQAGGLIVGASYASLFGDAGLAGVFDAGLCAGLLVLLLADGLASRRSTAAIPLFLVFALPIILNPEPALESTARWSATLFHVALFFELHRAHAERRASRTMLPLGLAMIALRWELALLVVPYVIGGRWLVRDPRAPRLELPVVAIGWLVLLVALRGGAAGVPLAIATTLGAGAITLLVVPLIGTFPVRSPAGVLCFAVVATILAAAVGVIPRDARSDIVAPAVWFGAAVAVAALSEHRSTAREGAPVLRVGAVALVISLFAAVSLLWPNFTSARRTSIRERYTDALARIEFVRAHGYDTSRDDAARSLQHAAPPGAVLGFWGASAAGLDYARNPIRDVSAVAGRRVPLTTKRLAGLDYVIVEDIYTRPPRTRRWDPWGAPPARSPIRGVASLELVASRGAIRLYRIAR